MNIKEFRNAIATSSSIEWFNTVSSIIDFSSYIDYRKEFTGIVALYEYLNKEVEKWEKHEWVLPPELNNSKNYFLNLRNLIDSLVASHINNPENYWRNIISSIQATNGFPLPYNNPTTSFLLDIFWKHWQKVFQWAFRFLIENKIDSNKIQEVEIWKILAYEFIMKDDTLLESRRNLEKKSLKQLHADYEKIVLEWTNQVAEHIKNTNDKFEEYSKSIDTLKTEKENAFNNWFNQAETTKAGIESTYKKLLELKEPARYWTERAFSLRIQWWIFTLLLWLFVALAWLILSELLFSTPEEFFEDLFWKDNKIPAIRWSIIFITFIWFIGYIIKILSRAMFSSFHLARDSEERATLAYVYLALNNETTVEKEDRLIILQSIFGRSDSWLLNTDTSIALPTINLK